VEPESVRGGHDRLVGRRSGEVRGDHAKCFRVVCVHVADDPRSGFSQGIGLRISVVLCRNPPHHTEAADEMDTSHLQAVVGEIGVILPELRVLVERQIQLPDLIRRHLRSRSQERERGCPERIARNILPA